MNGTDATTGKALGGIDHLRQSVRDILTTRPGDRVMLEEYGSRLFQLIDAPMTRATLLDVYAATVEALNRWEPRFKTTKVQATAAEPGKITLDITGEYLPSGEVITLYGVEIN